MRSRELGRVVFTFQSTLIGLVLVIAAAPSAQAVGGAGQTPHNGRVAEPTHPQALGEPVLGGVDVAKEEVRQRHVYELLTADEVQGAADRALSVHVSAEELRKLVERDAADPRTLVGLVKDVDVVLRFAPPTPDNTISTPRPDLAFGGMRLAGDGFVWTGAVRSENAAALRLHITDLDLPEGVELYVYNRMGHAAGPYIGRGPGGLGELWTNTLSGNELILQLRYRGGRTAEVLEGSGFTIVGVGHLTESFAAALAMGLRPTTLGPDADALVKTFCTWGIYTNASCIENAQCHSATMPTAVWNAAHRGIAHIAFPTWPSLIAICSGGLLNDKDPGGQVPYFLTAHHCISGWAEAAGMEAWFGYDAPCEILGIPFTGPCLGPLRIADNIGATVLATSSSSDYTLLKLWLPPPPFATLMGWDATPVSGTDGYGLYRISHPSGAPQAYSEHAVSTSAGECTSRPRGSFIYSRDTLGATEGGSSGSPVLNSSGQVVGQLYGSCGSNLDDVCDSQSNATVDGALAAYFCDVKAYLDPLDEPPVALCGDVSADADELTCDAQVTASDVDQGSYDPGGGGVSLSLDPAGPFGIGSTEVTLEVEGDCGDVGTCEAAVVVSDVTAPSLDPVPDVTAECSSPEGTPVELPEPTWTEHCSLPVELSDNAPDLFPLGSTSVTVTVTDGAGNASSTTAQVTVADTTAPFIACNAPATITPPDVPLSLTATSSDACGSAEAVVTGYDCYKYTRNGRRVDKRDSCVVTFAGDEVTILDSGGVGDTISWTVTATDEHGNQGTGTCILSVANPGH